MSEGGIAADALRDFVRRIERTEEEIRDLNTDKRDIYAEAKGNGFDVKTMKRAVQLRRQDVAERHEADALLDIYLQALGMLPDAASHVQAHPRVENIEEFRDRGGDDATPLTAADAGQAADESPAHQPIGEAEEVFDEETHSRRIGTERRRQSVSENEANTNPTAGSVVTAGETAPIQSRKPFVLRPNCQNPEQCSSPGGAVHCHSCQRAVEGRQVA